jgi:hypothetical protein
VTTDLCFKVAMEANFECGSFVSIKLIIITSTTVHYNYAIGRTRVTHRCIECISRGQEFYFMTVLRILTFSYGASVPGLLKFPLTPQ